MGRNTCLSAFVPTWRARSVLAVTQQFLELNGLYAVIFDLDSTLRCRFQMPTKEIDAHLETLINAQFGLYIVSNNPHFLLRKPADRLGIDYVACGVGGVPRKPAPAGFEVAIKELGTTPAQTLVVGDQFYSDIRGGNAAGCPTLLVDPLPGWEWPHMWWKRRKERKLVAALASSGCRLPTYID